MKDEPKSMYRIETNGGTIGGITILDLRLSYPKPLGEGHIGIIAARCDELLRELDLETMRVDPGFQEEKKALLTEMRRVFDDAGLHPIFIEEIPNEYSARPHDPWLIVTTRIGHFKIGWRKRVIVLNWSRTIVKTKADFLFGGEQVTMDALGHEIHCWGYEKATEYVRKITAEAPAWQTATS